MSGFDKMSSKNAAVLNMALSAQEALFERFVQEREKSEHPKRRRNITSKLEALFKEIVQNEIPELLIEIGAHEATFSREMKATLPEARSIAFEGNPNVYNRHKDALTAAGVESVNLCVADKPGTIEFHIPVIHDDGAPMETMGSLLKFTDTDKPHKVIQIPSTTLDAHLGHDVDKSKVLWVDVEGAAGIVFEGAKRSLETCTAVFLEIERTTKWEGKAALDTHIQSFLAQFGLVPVFRDVQRYKWQYNVIYLRHELLGKKYIRDLFDTYLKLPAPAMKKIEAASAVAAE